MMRVIPTVFLRDQASGWVVQDPDPACLWVLQGQGRATRRYGGQCVMRDLGGRWWVRAKVPWGRPHPPGLLIIERDPATARTVGWVPLEGTGFQEPLQQALDRAPRLSPGTYQLIGPGIAANLTATPTLVPHGWMEAAQRRAIEAAPRTHHELGPWLHTHPYLGLVFHHLDGTRLAKINTRDFPPPDPGPSQTAP